MSPANSDRIYLAVKREVLSGRFMPGERVDAVALAQEQFASLTPIRAVLHRLVGERLVQTQASEGFHAPPLTELGLRDLLTCNGQILVHAIAVSIALHRRGLVPPEATPPAVDGDAVVTIESAFLTIARASGSEECAWAIMSFNDRLHAVRRLEGRLFEDDQAEVDAIVTLIRSGNAASLRTAVLAYHRRRVALVPALVRLRHRAPAE